MSTRGCHHSRGWNTSPRQAAGASQTYARTHARLCRRSASGYCRFPHTYLHTYLKSEQSVSRQQNCIVSAHEYYGHNSIKSNVQTIKVEFIQILRFCGRSNYFIVSTSKNSGLIIQNGLYFSFKILCIVGCFHAWSVNSPVIRRW